MGNRKIGLREIRALKPGQVIWDAAVVGFGARRQRVFRRGVPTPIGAGVILSTRTKSRC